MKWTIHEFFFFSRGERRGILLLVLAIGVVLLVGYVNDRSWRHPALPADSLSMQKAAEEYSAFIASVERADSAEARRYRKPYSYATTADRRTQKLVPVPFDPNSADSALFVEMGLPTWMARNIVRYREKGGRFRKPEDFRKIYGLTDAQYSRLFPYIKIAADSSAKVTPVPDLFLPRTPADSLLQAQSVKYPPGTVVDLNRADTTELKKIPGIGSVIARMIVSYRTRLGGFYDVAQLREIRLDDSKLDAWFRVDTTAIVRIDVNRTGLHRLRRHPYIGFYRARALVEYREEHGDIHSLKPFQFYEEFSPTDFQRLSHYLSFTPSKP